jgi:hypothetical protein
VPDCGVEGEQALDDPRHNPVGVPFQAELVL